MANNNVPTSRKSNVNIILAASGWTVIFTALAVAAGFYAGYQYREGQVSSTTRKSSRLPLLHPPLRPLLKSQKTNPGPQ